MFKTIMSHSKKIKAVVPLDGAMINPPVPAGVSQPPLAQTVAAIKSFVATRTFTKQTWSTFLWAPSNSIRTPNAEDQAGAVGMTQKTLDFWVKEMKRHGLDSANGVPEPSFVNDGLCRVFRSTSIASSAIRDSACDGSNDILGAINSEFPGALAGMSQDNLVGWGLLDGTGSAAEIFETPKYTYPDEATAEATAKAGPDWLFQRRGKFFITIGDRAWMPIESKGQHFFFRKTSPNAWYWKESVYPWIDLGPYCTSIADAVSKGVQPVDGYITIKGVGCFQNTTGAAGAFDVNTWSAFKTEFSAWFVACAHGRIAVASTGLSRLKDGYSDYNQLANHEVGHNLGAGHNSNGPNATLSNPSGGSGHYGDQAANFGQAAMVYVAKNHFGVSDVPSDYNNPIWTFDTQVIGPSDDGSLWPTIRGRVQASNSADVPLFAVVAYVQELEADGVTSKSEYADATMVGALIQSDGTYSVKLEHFAPTGRFKIRSMQALNMAGKRKDIPLTGFTNFWSY